MEQVLLDSCSSGSGIIPTLPNSPEATIDIPDVLDTGIAGLIGELHPLNNVAKNAFHILASRRGVSFYEYHSRFVQVTSVEGTQAVGHFVFALSNLPEFATIGWRIGRGRKKFRNFSVDILLPVEEDEDDTLAGLHARFAWVKGGGGFFLIADNAHGKQVTLNGEELNREKKLIPYQNAIGIGEHLFTLKFPKRTTEQDEQFQTELAAFYSTVLQDSVPMVASTPREHEIMMGDWAVRNAIAKGAFGHVYVVTNTRTGEAAAAKELWRTQQNYSKVDEEVAMTRHLMGTKHKNLATPFEIRHELIHSKNEKARIMSLLDKTWQPGPQDVLDKFIFFSPLSTSTFYSLITSRASKAVRTRLFTQIIEGVAFLHKEGIAHRDIKPSNLTVESYDPPLAQIIDFGSATLKNPILYDRPGTVPYLAPEQREREYHGREVDYWACALVGLEILGYQLPNRPSRQVNEKDFGEMRKWLQPKVDAIAICCKGMLQWEPSERMTAEYALEHCLAPYRESAPTLKRGPSK